MTKQEQKIEDLCYQVRVALERIAGLEREVNRSRLELTDAVYFAQYIVRIYVDPDGDVWLHTVNGERCWRGGSPDAKKILEWAKWRDTVQVKKSEALVDAGQFSPVEARPSEILTICPF